MTEATPAPVFEVITLSTPPVHAAPATAMIPTLVAVDDEINAAAPASVTESGFSTTAEQSRNHNLNRNAGPDLAVVRSGPKEFFAPQSPQAPRPHARSCHRAGRAPPIVTLVLVTIPIKTQADAQALKHICIRLVVSNISSVIALVCSSFARPTPSTDRR